MTLNRAAGAAPPDERPGQGRHHRTSHARRAGGTTRPPTTTRGTRAPGPPPRGPTGRGGGGTEAHPGPSGRGGRQSKSPRAASTAPPGLNQIHRDSTQTIRPYISITTNSADTAFSLPPDERKLPPLPVPPPHGEAPGAIPGACMAPIPPRNMCPDARVNVWAIDIVAPGGSINFDSIRAVLTVRHRWPSHRLSLLSPAFIPIIHTFHRFFNPE